MVFQCWGKIRKAWNYFSNWKKRSLRKGKKSGKINNNLTNISDSIKYLLEQENYNKDFNINFGNNYFPEKTLNGINYKEGNYESVVINLGESKGNNWWCVLFPPLCMIEAKKNDTDFVEYKSKVLEILNNYK